METLINNINFETLKNYPSLQAISDEKINEITDHLNEFKSKIRTDLTRTIALSRKLTEAYLHGKYPEKGLTTEPYLIIKDLRDTKAISIEEDKALTILRIVGNHSGHVEGVNFARYTQNVILKVFILWIALIEEDYNKYFSNLQEVMQLSNQERNKYKGFTFEQITKQKLKDAWVFDFLERLSINSPFDDLSEFPIGNYEIVSKYPTDYGYDNLFENYTFKAKEKGKENYYYIIPAIKEKDASIREDEVSSIIRGEFSYNFLKFESSIPFSSTCENNEDCEYRVYEFRKDTQRLDEYVSNNQTSKLDALKMIKQLTDVFCEYKNNFHHRSLDEKAIFVNKRGNDYLLQISSFKYAKAQGAWENYIKGVTTAATQIKELEEHVNHFSIAGDNKLLFEEWQYMKNKSAEQTSYMYEKFDVYSLICLLAYILDKQTGVSKKLSFNAFSDFSQNFKRTVSNMVDASSYDEVIGLDELQKLLEGEICANN